MLQRKRNEEARYRKSIGLRSYSTFFNVKKNMDAMKSKMLGLKSLREKEQIKKI